jgi:hypothetical protein
MIIFFVIRNSHLFSGEIRVQTPVMASNFSNFELGFMDIEKLSLIENL